MPKCSEPINGAEIEVSPGIGKASSDPIKTKKLLVNPLDCCSNRHLNNSALVYKVLSKVESKIFLQRNLLFRKRFSLSNASTTTKRPSNLKRKRVSQTLEPTKRRKLDKLLEKNGTNVKQEFIGRMQVIVKDISDESRLFDDVDVEAFVLKLDQSLANNNSGSDGAAIHKIGTFKVQGNSPKKSTFPSLPLSIDLPPEAFQPLNGYLNWINWLIFRCSFNSNNDERQLRRFGHRASSDWQNTPSVVRMASLPLCNSGVTLLTDGDLDLKFLWKTAKTDEQLIESIKYIFKPGHRSSGTPPQRVNGKNDNDSLYMKVTIRWITTDPSLDGINSWPTLEFRRSVDDLIILKGLKQSKSPRKRKSSVPSSIVYRFVCSGSKNCAPCRMQTVADDPSTCPFCKIWVEDLYFLLKHLRCCHFRFNFHHKLNYDKNIIEVRPNINFDTSDEVKSAFVQQLTRRKCRPTKNSPAENIFWIRRLSNNQIMDENRSIDEFKFFAAPESPNSRRQKTFNAHKRRYYHSQTCMPLTQAEFENDSEGEMAPDWLESTRTKMIEEFSDVNLGEKKIMQLWNNHLMKNNFVGDNQISVACQTLWDAEWRQIYPEFVQNFIVHIQNLFASGVLTQQQIYTLATKIKQTKKETEKKDKKS